MSDSSQITNYWDYELGMNYWLTEIMEEILAFTPFD